MWSHAHVAWKKPSSSCCSTRSAIATLALGERLFQALVLSGKQLAAILRQVPVVFEADSKLAADVNPGLVAEAHVRFELGLVPADKISPLVAIHANAVAEPVREEFVVRSVARVGDHLARGGVNRLRLNSRSRCCERSRLRAMHDLEILQRFVAG